MTSLLKIITSNVPYYLDILENSFTDFLEQQGASVKTRKNYRSDARHFLGWFLLTIEATKRITPRSHTELLKHIDESLLESYKNFLTENAVPVSTINRRLSTMRSFFGFCASQRFISKNPAAFLTNLPDNSISKSLGIDTVPSQQILDSFRRDLLGDGASKSTAKNYVSDVRQFLHWLREKSSQ